MIRVMGEGLRKRPCLATKDLEERTFYADAGEGPSEQWGAHTGSWAEHSWPAQGQWESQRGWSRVSRKRKVTNCGKVGWGQS